MKKHSSSGFCVIILFCAVLAVLTGLCAYILFLRFLPESDPSPVSMSAPTAIPVIEQPSVNPPAPVDTDPLVPAANPGPDSDRQFSFESPTFWMDGVLSTETTYRSPTVSVSVKAVYDTKNFLNRVTYYVGDVYVADVTQIRTESFNGNFTKMGQGEVSKMAKRTDSLIAISGDYYGYHSDSLVIRNGTVYRASLSKRGDVCLLLRDGTMETISRKDIDLDEVLKRDPWQAWQFGPSLLNADGSACKSFPTSTLSKQNPRSAIGFVEPGHYVFVVVDGRQSHSAGVTLAELSKLMHELGCKVAFNLDGGASAHFYWNNRIFNLPSKGGRQISDIVYVARSSCPVSTLFHGKEGTRE